MSEDDIKFGIETIFESLCINAGLGRTHLVLIIVDNGDPVKGTPPSNMKVKVRCYHGNSFEHGYPYDQSCDSYIVPCVDHLYLGHVPVSFEVGIKDDSVWKTEVPLPSKVIDRFLNATQKKQISEMQKKYKSPRYRFSYIQMTGCEV